MIKYFCDRCGKEIVNNTSAAGIKVEAYIYDDNFIVHEDKGDYHAFLCDRCEYLLKRFLKNELNIDYGPNSLGY